MRLINSTISLPLNYSTWTLTTGDLPALCLLLELISQELQSEILCISSVRYLISPYI